LGIVSADEPTIEVAIADLAGSAIGVLNAVFAIAIYAERTGDSAVRGVGALDAFEPVAVAQGLVRRAVRILGAVDARV